MMTQEEFMDVVALRRQGWTITDIAAAVGRHPETVSKWLKAGGPPTHRVVTDTVVDEQWAARIGELTVPIETDPGEEAQADWSDCTAWGRAWGLGVLHCFGAILAWSRRRFWWFAASVDREHTLEGMVRFFEDVGGVAGVMRIDNMGALVARSHPRLVVHPPAREFAAAHGFTFAGCWPGDGARKGKVERPFRELKEA